MTGVISTPVFVHTLHQWYDSSIKSQESPFPVVDSYQFPLKLDSDVPCVHKCVWKWWQASFQQDYWSVRCGSNSCAATHGKCHPHVVRGDGGSEVPWPLGPNIWLGFSSEFPVLWRLKTRTGICFDNKTALVHFHLRVRSGSRCTLKITTGSCSTTQDNRRSTSPTPWTCHFEARPQRLSPYRQER